MALQENEPVLKRDFSRPITFDLAEAKPNKTVDIGTNGTSVSADPLGLILQLSTYHPEHGIIVAAPYEQFDGSKFREPLVVRAYRRRMTDLILAGEPGFGVRLRRSYDGRVDILHQSLDTAVFRYSVDEDVAVTYTLQVLGSGEIVQKAELANSSHADKEVHIHLDLGLSVHRASYGQLTEGGPIPLPKSENVFKVDPDATKFTVTSPHLGAHVRGSFAINERPVNLGNLPGQTSANSPVSAKFEDDVRVLAGGKVSLESHFSLFPWLPSATERSVESAVIQSIHPTPANWRDANSIESYIMGRNINYIMANCCVPISDQDIAIITDHVALPLGWNRDNYWQMRLLLKASANAEAILDKQSASAHLAAFHRIVKGHLHWVFRKAERPHGFWHRSYLVTGRPKDGPVFQLDQQCYPFLELCDFADQYPEELAFARSLLLGSNATSQVLELILSRRDQKTGLFPTDETPGDDAVEYPYHFSSHVLLWYTLSRLSRLLAATAPTEEAPVENGASSSLLNSQALDAIASSIRSTALSHFMVPEHPATGLPTFAYLASGSGQHTFYHDANDIPTLFAPAWLFLTSESELAAWHNTMAFAVSPANEGGYYAPDDISVAGGHAHSHSSDSSNSAATTASLTPSQESSATTASSEDGHHRAFYGLGSVHSASPWPLGYFQEWVYAGVTGDAVAEADAWRRIAGVMQWDGTFCEAVDPRKGGCWSKCWFSWPGAMIAAELVERWGRQERPVASKATD